MDECENETFYSIPCVVNTTLCNQHFCMYPLFKMNTWLCPAMEFVQILLIATDHLFIDILFNYQRKHSTLYLYISIISVYSFPTAHFFSFFMARIEIFQNWLITFDSSRYFYFRPNEKHITIIIEKKI